MTKNVEPVGSRNPFVGVVILTWNDTEMTGECLKSVFASSYDNRRVVLVDNGSKEPCGRKLQDVFPNIDLIVLPKNKGFTGGANAGLRRAMEFDPKYIFFLNNDTVVGAQSIGRLVHALEARDDCGIAHALLLYPNERRVQFYTASIDRNLAQHRHQEVDTPLDSRHWPTVECEFVPSCAILFRTAALKETGLYDETFGTSWEDYDLCIRFSDAGWKIIAVGDAHVEHRSHQTTGNVSAYITYYSTRNRLICLRRHGTFRGVLFRAPLIARTFYWQIKSYGLKNWACHRSFARGLWDFITGRRGEDTAARNRRD